jgi:hypothetical protein
MNPHYHYTPYHEPSPPSLSGPTTHYLVVSSSLSSSTNAVIVRHCCHHGVGCCLVPPAAAVILTIVVHRRCNPTNDGVPAALPHSPPPLRSPPPLPLRPLRPLNRPWRCHGPACGVDALPPGPTQQVPLPHAPPLSGYGPIAPAPPS